MKIMIGSSSIDEIDEIYKKESEKIIRFLASNDNTLIWGCGNTSLMGMCYDIFSNNNCNIIGYTTPKYEYMLKDFTKANIEIVNTTFELKEKLYKNAEMIVFLPGGIGTVSELFSFIEEYRSNDTNKKIIICNINHIYDECLKVLDKLIDEKFANPKIKNCFNIVSTFEEFNNEYIKMQ